jgi:hypothetical protein
MRLNGACVIVSLAGIRISLPKSEGHAEPRVRPRVAAGGQVLSVQGAGIEQTPVGTIVTGQVAIGDGNLHPGGQKPPVEDLEEFALRVSGREGPGFQLRDVALQHERAMLVAVEGLGQFCGHFRRVVCLRLRGIADPESAILAEPRRRTRRRSREGRHVTMGRGEVAG